MPTALVTGVSRGLGKHICHVLQAAGYRVLGIGLAAEPSHDAVDAYRKADLRDPSAADPFPEERVDVLVNNAGVYLDDPRKGYGDFFALSPDDLRETFEVNLMGTAGMVLRYAPTMRSRGTGRIVCVSSGMGRLQDTDGRSFAYRSSKLAVNSLVLTVAHHFADDSGDLSAFAYCPGWIRTDMGTSVAPSQPEPAAGELVRLLALPSDATNGRFFRGGAERRELGWDIDPSRAAEQHRERAVTP